MSGSHAKAGPPLITRGNEPVSACAEALLFAAARAQLVEDVIRPALERGATVIADRYVGSSLVYQGVVRGVGAGAVRTINDIGTGGLMPDATVLLTVSAEQAAARRDPGTDDRIEREPLEFHRDVIAAYEDVLSANGHLVHVDGSGEADVIAARVREALGL